MATDDFRSELETDYPHLVGKICSLWGQKEAIAYLRSLITTDRPERQGFPEEVALAFLFLEEVHYTAYPETRPKWNEG